MMFLSLQMPFTGRQKVLSVLEYARKQSYKTVQHAFVREFSKQSPISMQIRTWNKKFKEEDCLPRKKGSGRPTLPEVTFQWVCKKILQSPKKSL